MFSALTRFFEDKMAPTDSTQAEDPLRVATCALLLEAAHADSDFSDEECETISTMVGRRFKLSPEDSKTLLEIADQQRRQQTDMYGFARLVNDNYAHPRKLAILEMLWEVVYSDGILEAHEDALMHKMGTLLGVRHEDLMAVKLRIKKSLDG
jgi:uncharacterized tellurite resistance protein B-like protein